MKSVGKLTVRIDVLERASIAWPNQSMWCSAPFSVSLSESPTHQRANNSHILEVNEATSSELRQPQVRPYLSTDIGGGNDGTQGDDIEQTSVTSAEAYFQWLNGLADEHSQIMNIQSGLTWGPRSNIATEANALDPNSTDNSSWTTDQDPNFTSAIFKPEDDVPDGNSRVPTNTPTAGGNPSYACGGALPTKFGVPSLTYLTLAVPQSLLPRSSVLPAALAHSLTRSILSQTPPRQVSGESQASQGPGIRSRKENRLQVLDVDALPPAMTASVQGTTDTRGIRKASQAFTDSEISVESGGSIGGASLDDGTLQSRSNSPLVAQEENSTQHDTWDTKAVLARSELAPDTALTATSGNSLSKGTKRNRNFTPASGEEFSDENEQRRVSPCVRNSPFRNELHQDYGTNE